MNCLTQSNIEIIKDNNIEHRTNQIFYIQVEYNQYMIFECPSGHICFSKDELTICGMRGCNKQIDMLSPDDIKWFYKINKNGLCITRTDLHMIIEDPNMPNDVKKQVQKIFTNIS